MEPKVFENIQVEIHELPSINELNFVPLEKAYLRILLLNSIIVFGILFIGLMILWFMDNEGMISPYFQWILLGFLGIFLLNLVLVYKSYQFKRYGFRHKDISFKSGWLWRKITTVPFNRVQHCEVSQGIFDRMFGLAKLKIFTAGGSSSDVSIPGLVPDEASNLKEYILGKVKDDE